MQRRGPWLPRPLALLAPLTVAAATGGAAFAAALFVDGRMQLFVQLLAGGAAFAFAIWAAELRGRLGRIGDGLAAASGLVQPPLAERR